MAMPGFLEKAPGKSVTLGVVNGQSSRGAPPAFWVGLALCVVAFPAHARLTGLHENHAGLTLSAGAYFVPSQSDPVPGFATAGTTVSGSESLKPLPLKIGYFTDVGPRLTFEPYLRVLHSYGGDWTSTGLDDGAGTTSVSGWGLGAHVHIAFLRDERIKMGVRADAEWAKEKYALSFRPAVGGPLENLKLASTALLVGGGIHTEVWLGDLWSFTLTLGYRYGFATRYSATTAGQILNQDVPAGTAKNVTDGTVIPARLGGFYLETGLKLSFF